MHIAHIRIQNIRGFGEGEQAVGLDLRRPDGGCAGWTVFAGRNGSGKTSLLQAMAVALLGGDAPLTQDTSRVSWVRQGAERAVVGIKLQVADDDQWVWVDWDDLLHPYEDQSPQWENAFAGEVARIREFDMSAELSWDWESASPAMRHRWPRDPTRPTADVAFRWGPWHPEPLGWFSAAYGPFRRLSGQSTESEALSRGSPRVAALAGLFREDIALGDAVRWLQELHYRRLDKGDPEIKHIEDTALALLSDDLLPDRSKPLRVDSDGLWIEQAGRSLVLERVSAGYQVTAALVLDILARMHRVYGRKLAIEHAPTYPRVRVTNSGVVLIDEAEEHLHVAWQRRIGFWLKEHFPNIQFLVTTHSPFICQAADANGLIRLDLPGESPAARHVDPETYRRVVAGGADDAVMSELFGLEHAHSDDAERDRERLADLEVRELDGGALSEAERQEMARLRDALPATPSAEVEQALRKLAKG